jgi:DNA-binding transcriptional LysR family regulator
LREPRFRINDLHGAIRIAATYSVLGYFLPPLFARFRANYPDIDFDLHDIGRRKVEAAVLSGELELGVVILSNVEDRERFGHHVLMRSRRQLWAAAGHPVLEEPYPSLADVARQPYILLTVDEGEESNRRYWTDNGLSPNIAFRTNGMEALRGLVAHGFGVTILSDMVYRPWSLEGKKIEARPILDAIPASGGRIDLGEGRGARRAGRSLAAVSDPGLRQLMNVLHRPSCRLKVASVSRAVAW